MSVAQYVSGFFLFQDFASCCTSYPQCLCDGTDLPSFLSFKMACFSPKDSPLVLMLVNLFKHKCSIHRQNPRLKPRVDIQNYLLLNQSIKQDTSWKHQIPSDAKSQMRKPLFTKHWLYMLHNCHSANRCHSLTI